MAPRSSLIGALRRRAQLTQRELAERAGTTQSAIARIESGASSPTLATIERLARAAGLQPRVEFDDLHAHDPVTERYKRDVDRTLIRENLKRSVDERLRMLMQMHTLADEMRVSKRRPRR
jgi:transcriptional regulator with XRE-family HTH domain